MKTERKLKAGRFYAVATWDEHTKAWSIKLSKHFDRGGETMPIFEALCYLGEVDTGDSGVLGRHLRSLGDQIQELYAQSGGYCHTGGYLC